MQASALQSISRCYRPSPSPGARVPGARVPVRQAPSMDWRVGGGGRGGWGHGGRGHPGDEGGKGGKRDLQEAYREVREMLTDPSRLVRAVASGKAKGADPEWRRLEMRPVALKGGVKLQVVKYDERQAFTSNHAYAGATPLAPGDAGVDARATGGADPSRTPKSPPVDADEAVDEALRCGFSNWRVETCEEVLSLRVTKSGEAAVSRRDRCSRTRTRAAAITRRRRTARSRTTGKSEGSCPRPIPFWVHAGVSTKDGSAIKADRRDKYKQVEEFVKLVDAVEADARRAGT